MRRTSPPTTETITAGASAQREYQRRKTRRNTDARAKHGWLGSIIAAWAGEPPTTVSWRQGAEAERATAIQLHRHLDRHGVFLLHDRRIPGRGRANIDHIAIAITGVTIIDTKGARGRIQLKQIGGLLSPRQELLLVNGRNRTAQLQAVERQIDAVDHALSRCGIGDIPLRGALCFPNIQNGLPNRGQLHPRDSRVVIATPHGVSRFVASRGPLQPGQLSEIYAMLTHALPRA
jgi:Nuclease-related domain